LYRVKAQIEPKRIVRYFRSRTRGTSGSFHETQ